MLINFTVTMFKKYFSIFRKVLCMLISAIMKLVKFLLISAIFVFLIAEPSFDYIFKQISSGQLFNLGIAVFTPLAVTITFSSLMYNRSRSVNSRLARFKSLYVAERLLEASKAYIIGLIFLFICYVITSKYNIDLNFSLPVKENWPVLIFLIVIFPLVSFLAEIFFVLKALGFEFGGRTPKFVAKKIRKLL